MLSFDLRGLALLIMVVSVMCALSVAAGGAGALLWTERQRRECAELRDEAFSLSLSARRVIDECLCAVGNGCDK